jgi:hypothetical protein
MILHNRSSTFMDCWVISSLTVNRALGRLRDHSLSQATSHSL